MRQGSCSVSVKVPLFAINYCIFWKNEEGRHWEFLLYPVVYSLCLPTAALCWSVLHRTWSNSSGTFNIFLDVILYYSIDCRVSVWELWSVLHYFIVIWAQHFDLVFVGFFALGYVEENSPSPVFSFLQVVKDLLSKNLFTASVFLVN